MLVIAAVAVILVLTLTPQYGPTEQLSGCVICGVRGIADAVLNVLLFVPLGAALAWAGLEMPRAVPIGFALTVCIELTQFLIPGRDPSLGDVTTNTLGTALGVLALRGLPHVLAWGRTRAAALSIVIPAATVAGLSLGALLMRPALPDGPWAPSWAASPSHPAWFGGKVRAADLGGVGLLRRHVRDGGRLRDLWLGGAPLRVSVVRPRGGPWLEPVFGVYDPGSRELLLLGFAGDDVVLRYRTVSGTVRLDEPSIRLVGAAPAAVDSTALATAPAALVEARRDGSGYCLSVNGTGHCGLGYGVGRSWAELMNPGLSPRLEWIVDLLWLLVLFLPSGLLVRRRTLWATSLVAFAGIAAIPSFSGLRPTSFGEFVAVALGLAVGAAVAEALRGLVRRAQASAVASPAAIAPASATRQRSIRA